MAGFIQAPTARVAQPGCRSFGVVIVRRCLPRSHTRLRALSCELTVACLRASLEPDDLDYNDGVGELAVKQLIGGRYQVLALLGQGGMGAVYRVLDERDGTELALKRLLSADPNRRRIAGELFEREYHTLSELAHPCIIAVHDYAVDADGPYYTMELLTGQDLRELGKQPWRKGCALLRDIASSLAILHSRRLLHCDVSPRNVRCTHEGRAKLLDFGAMAPMGVAKRVAGTPPFMSPEMVQLQALDGRSDLFGLGALAYWLLTGRTAYPARTIAELRDIWRRSPVPPSELDPEIPEALSELVMECIALNRNARPRSAGVVMERLCALAGLSYDEAETARAYLTTPTLVGREQQLNAVRARLLRAAPAGAVLCLSGVAGSGRSRMLDACVLEGKLLGWHVLRADAGDALGGDYGVARVLCEQLFALAPERARTAVHVHAAVLAHVLGTQLAGAQPCAPPPPRRALLSALRDFMLNVTRPVQVMIAVDDVDRIDDTSAGLLVALAQRTERRALCVVVSSNAAAEGSAALDALFELATSIEVPPLDESQSELLVRSVFGEATHGLTLARRLHALAQGNPRTIMQLLEHLIEQGIARYEAGAFLLPERLDEQDFPSSLADAFERRVRALGADALELLQVLSLTEPSELAPSSYHALTTHQDRTRTYRAIDELVLAHIVEAEAERYRFCDASIRGVAQQRIGPAARLALHARLARVFEANGTIARRALHLMESQQTEAAIHVFIAQSLKNPLEPSDPLEDYVPGILDLLERAACMAESLELLAPMRIEMRMKTAGASQFMGDVPRFLRLAPPLLRDLLQQSGLGDYYALDEKMEPMARLTDALTRVQQRYDARPATERGLAPIDAIRELSRLCAMYAGVSALSIDAALLASVPSLAPLVPLSPAIGAIQLFIDSTEHMVRGRSLRARTALIELLARLDSPDRAGLGALYHKSIKLGALYILGLLEAGLGIREAASRIADLEREPGHRVNAQRVHVVCHLMHGDFEAAAAAQRRAELVMLQDGMQQRYPGTTARSELTVYALVDDLAGLKQVMDRLHKISRALPKWASVATLAECEYKRVQGDPHGALALLEPALAQTPALEHRDFSALAATQLRLLVECGRAQEAVEVGTRYIELCRREELTGERAILQQTAEALLVLGRCDEAERLASELFAEIERNGAAGVPAGLACELRARVAIARRDASAFQHWLARCAAEYRVERNLALAARHERLQQAARDAGLIEGVESSAARMAASTREDLALISVVQSRMVGCTDAASRVACALMILNEYTCSEQGYLFGVREGRAKLLCALPQAVPPAALGQAVDAYLEHERGEEDDTQYIEQASTEAARESESDSAPAPSISQLRFADAHSELQPLLIASAREGQTVVAGVACLRLPSGVRRMAPGALLETLASALLDHDDVDPMTCLG